MRLILALLCLLTPPLHAASFSAVGDAEMGCTMTLDGKIVPGDAKALRAFMAQQGVQDYAMYSRERLCLNSPGGTFTEGVAIAQMLSEAGIGTAVAAKAECVSACAIAFMGGRQHGEEGSARAHRLLHPQGRLGFHAPSLNVAEDDYTKAEVDRSFGLALGGISTLVSARHRAQFSFPESLLIVFLDTPSDDMRYVTTVADAVRWEIAIHPLALPSGDPVDAVDFACRNGEAMIGDIEPAHYPMELGPDFLQTREVTDYALRLVTQPNYRIEAMAQCELNLSRDPVWTNGALGYFTYPGDRDESIHTLWPHMLYAPTTPIAALPTRGTGTVDLSTWLTQLRNAPPAPAAQAYDACTLPRPEAQIANVTNYVNLRRNASLGARVVRQVPLAEPVTITGQPVISQDAAARGQACIAACKGWLGGDPSARAAGIDCVAGNVIWYPIRDARGNAGWVSRRYLGDR